MDFSPFLVTLSFTVHLAISERVDFSSHKESIQRHITTAHGQFGVLPAQFLWEKIVDKIVKSM